jgi:hypothetical protein
LRLPFIDSFIKSFQKLKELKIKRKITFFLNQQKKKKKREKKKKRGKLITLMNIGMKFGFKVPKFTNYKLKIALSSICKNKKSYFIEQRS